MSAQLASLMLLYNGRLTVNEDLAPTYTGGKNRPLQVPTDTPLNVLKLQVLHSIQYDVSRFTVNLVCRLPVGVAFVATAIEDDDVCQIILKKAVEQFLILYVEIESLPDTDIAGPSTQYTEMLFEGTEQILEAPLLTEDRYESMGSPINENSSDNSGNSYSDEECMETREITDKLIQDYSFRNLNMDDLMTCQNEYAAVCQTEEEWDAQIEFDGFDDNLITVSDLSIPDELYEGMCFKTKWDLQFALQGWSIMHNVEYQVTSSNNIKFTVACIKKDLHSRPCHWRLHASSSKRLGGMWKISTIKNEHCCVNPILLEGHKQCTSRFMSYFIQPSIRSQLDIKPREIMARIEAKFNIRVTYMKAWDARQKAIKNVFGSWEASYRSLYLFMEAINSAMPGSVYRIQTIQADRFQRLFWSFRPCIEGWKFCRPVLSLDGTFLVGKYRGTLLSAVGIDANNGLFPLAFAVVESECNDSWFWFLRCLLELLPYIIEREDLCLISDRHSGLVRGCRELFPWAAHRSCLRHLRENFKKAIRRMGIGDVEFLCQKMYQAGCTPDSRVFNRHMTDIRNVKEEAYQWLIEHDISRWALTSDHGFRYGTMTTNASESYNGVLKRARGLPIQALITAIYYNIIGIFIKRRNQVIRDEESIESPFCKAPLLVLQNAEEEARHIREPTRINQSEFQVFDRSGRSYRVDVQEDGKSRCQCGKPEIYHMPCAHVISSLSVIRCSHFDYVSHYYRRDYYKATYGMDFHSIPDRTDWGSFDRDRCLFPLGPPNYKRRTGRPRSRRYKNTMDESTSRSTRTCSYCHISGHNITTCPRRLS